MRIAVDTNVLVRSIAKDDVRQSKAAIDAMSKAGAVIVSTQALCELAWVLSRQYKTSRPAIVSIFRQLIDTENFVVDRPAVEAGLAMLEAGADFADGVIAYDGRRLGAETFVSFDKDAVTLLAAAGEPARLLG